MTQQSPKEQIPFSDFLKNFNAKIKSAFYERDNIEKFIQKRGFPYLALKEIMSANPFAAAIPKEYGGRGADPKECIAVLDAASYESLPLSLTCGINMALFLSPVAKYGQHEAKEQVFSRFLNHQNMGGLMITEPDFGSDALSMQTYNVPEGKNYRVNGTKHWQGLTGMADFWLLTSRRKTDNGTLARDIDFFISDDQAKNQKIKVDEYYNNAGLYPIPYGKNIIDVEIPETHKLVPESTGLKLMMDLLHRSRYNFPGMGMGFIRRMLDEAIDHCSKRIVGGKPLINLDQVKHQISRIQSAFTVCSAMCSRSGDYAGIGNNLATDAIEANVMKAYVTDLMQESAQTYTQLKGANGYKEECVGIRGIVDSRPFQIFEGSNDMLYTQISEMLSKLMLRKKTENLGTFLMQFNLTKNVASSFKSLLDFKVDFKADQRKHVDLGKIMARVISADLVLQLQNKGFRDDLVANSIDTLKQDVQMLIGSYLFKTNIAPISDYKGNANWLNF